LLEQVKEKRFPGGMAVCQKCEGKRKHYRVAGRTAYACATAESYYTLAGTIFEEEHHSAPHLVSGNVPDGVYSLRDQRKADSARKLE